MDIEQQLDMIMKRLTSARKENKLTQTEAALQVGLGCASSLSQYEQGKRGSTLNLRLFLKLCIAYDVDPVWALTGTYPPIATRKLVEHQNKIERADYYIQKALEELQS